MWPPEPLGEVSSMLYAGTHTHTHTHAHTKQAKISGSTLTHWLSVQSQNLTQNQKQGNKYWAHSADYMEHFKTLIAISPWTHFLLSLESLTSAPSQHLSTFSVHFHFFKCQSNPLLMCPSSLPLTYTSHQQLLNTKRTTTAPTSRI